uniref:Uncharacterized protein n=1 Tax=Panagrolaimus sp. ES5 TaxID=591445 RepID=A0AC34F1N5_9BILA
MENDDGTLVALEKLVEVLPKLKEFDYFTTTPPGINITSKTVTEILKIPHFLKMEKFSLTDIPEVFDIETFYIYMKTNRLTKFYLSFENKISHAFKNRLQAIVDEILATKYHNYKCPVITFYPFDGKKYKKMRDLQRRL